MRTAGGGGENTEWATADSALTGLRRLPPTSIPNSVASQPKIVAKRRPCGMAPAACSNSDARTARLAQYASFFVSLCPVPYKCSPIGRRHISDVPRAARKGCPPP
jgi:hypothetical protein